MSSVSIPLNIESSSSVSEEFSPWVVILIIILAVLFVFGVLFWIMQRKVSKRRALIMARTTVEKAANTATAESSQDLANAGTEMRPVHKNDFVMDMPALEKNPNTVMKKLKSILKSIPNPFKRFSEMRNLRKGEPNLNHFSERKRNQTGQRLIPYEMEKIHDTDQVSIANDENPIPIMLFADYNAQARSPFDNIVLVEDPHPRMSFSEKNEYLNVRPVSPPISNNADPTQMAIGESLDFPSSPHLLRQITNRTTVNVVPLKDASSEDDDALDQRRLRSQKNAIAHRSLRNIKAARQEDESNLNNSFFERKRSLKSNSVSRVKSVSSAETKKHYKGDLDMSNEKNADSNLIYSSSEKQPFSHPLDSKIPSTPLLQFDTPTPVMSRNASIPLIDFIDDPGQFQSHPKTSSVSVQRQKSNRSLHRAESANQAIERKKSAGSMRRVKSQRSDIALIDSEQRNLTDMVYPGQSHVYSLTSATATTAMDSFQSSNSMQNMLYSNPIRVCSDDLEDNEFLIHRQKSLKKTVNHPESLSNPAPALSSHPSLRIPPKFVATKIKEIELRHDDDNEVLSQRQIVLKKENSIPANTSIRKSSF